MPKLPESVTRTLYIHLMEWSGEIMLFEQDMSEYGHALIGTHEVTVPVPQIDPTLKMIEVLEHKRKMIYAESERQLARIDDQIAKLRAITYQPESSDA